MSFRPGPPPRSEDDDDDTLVMSAPPVFSTPPRPLVQPNVAACDEIAEQLAVATSDVLSLDLELHLDGCPTCLRRVQEASRLAEGVREVAAGYAHAVDFEARVLRAIDAHGTR